jgi:phage minor structural protein
MLEIYDLNRKRIAILENAFNVSTEEKINSISFLRFSLSTRDSKNIYCKQRNYVSCNGEWFRLMDTLSIEREKEIISYEAEHVLATLVDNLLFGHHLVGGKGVYTREVLEYILEKQNYWKLKNCEFENEYEYGFEQESLLSAIFSVTQPFENYKWETNTKIFPWELSLVKLNLNKTPDIYISKQKNLLSATKRSDPKALCTRLYPLGYGEGINQLNIKTVNLGIPYLESPKDVVAKFGIIEKVWVDRKFEDAKSLKAAAETMLKNLQEPRIEYEIEYAEIDKRDIQKIEIGKIVEVRSETGTIKTVITGNSINYEEIETSTINIANSPQDIAESIGNIADRQRIEMTYSQGATQLYGQSLQVNADRHDGAEMNFFIPSEMRIINKVLVKLKIESFRAYSKAIKGGGNFTGTTKNGGDCLNTTQDGGSYIDTTEDGGGCVNTTEDGGGANTTTTSGGAIATTTEDGGESIELTAREGDVEIQKTTEEGGDFYEKMTLDVNQYFGDNSSGSWNDPQGHNHGIRRGTRLATVDKNLEINGYTILAHSGNHDHKFKLDLPAHTHEVEIKVPSHKHKIEIPEHNHEIKIPEHNHEVEISNHVHKVEIPAHNHGIKIPSHKHKIEIPEHKHEVEIPDHTHEIEAGIYRLGYPRYMTISVDGKFLKRTVMNAEIDITDALIGEQGTINRGVWHNIKVIPNDLAYVSIDMCIQGFVQSRGDKTV